MTEEIIEGEMKYRVTIKKSLEMTFGSNAPDIETANHMAVIEIDKYIRTLGTYEIKEIGVRKDEEKELMEDD